VSDRGARKCSQSECAAGCPLSLAAQSFLVAQSFEEPYTYLRGFLTIFPQNDFRARAFNSPHSPPKESFLSELRLRIAAHRLPVLSGSVELG